jgi:hypothetical protein
MAATGSLYLISETFGFQILLTQQKGYEVKQYNTFQEYSPIIQTSKFEVEWVAAILRVWEAPGSNISTGTDNLH